jgi:hypothetical protein
VSRSTIIKKDLNSVIWRMNQGLEARSAGLALNLCFHMYLGGCAGETTCIVNKLIQYCMYCAELKEFETTVTKGADGS